MTPSSRKPPKQGDKVKDFKAVDHNGTHVQLSEILTHGPAVIFFYPRAMSPGCTRQSCYFRDLSSEFGKLGASVVGISVDNGKRLKRFQQSNELGFILLSDHDREISKSFGALWPWRLFTKRITFVISKDATILDVIRSETDMSVHADKALAALRRAKAERA